MTTVSDLNLKSFDRIYPLLVQKYNTLVPDPNANILDKINSIVDYLNSVGKVSNDVVDNWNKVMAWTMADGLTTDVNNKLETMMTNGEFNSILTSLFNAEIGDLTTLQTNDKSKIVNAINEVEANTKANATTLTSKANQSDLNTTNQNVATNTQNITTNTQNIASNTSSLAANTQRIKTAWIDVKQDYGAIGDNTLHTISSVFPNVTLAQVQALNSSATLSNSADWYALQLAINNEKFIFVPQGTYIIDLPLTINNSNELTIFTNSKVNTIIQNNGTGHGITINKFCYIHNLTCTGNHTNGSGFFINSGCFIQNIRSNNNGRYGIEFSTTNHIVSCYIDKAVNDYNGLGGVISQANSNSQKNNIVLSKIYNVKNGTNADNLTANATIGSGDGMYISGGYSIAIIGCVFEYNTGLGLHIDSQSYPVNGISVVSPYFEFNKYGQCMVDNSFANYLLGVNVFGETYTDAGITPVANSLSNRQLYVTKPNGLLNNQNSNFLGQYSFSERNMKTRRPNMLNAFPVNRMTDLSVDYPNNITTYNSDTVFQITNSVSGVTFNSELIHIDPLYDYIFSYDVTKTSTTASPNMLSYLYDNDSGATISTAATYLGAGSFGWTTKYFKITGLSASKVLRLYLNVEGTTPSDLQVYVKNIRLIPILKNPLYNGFNVAVGASATTLAVSFTTAEADTNYAVSVSPAWNTTYWITNKTTSGFTINFGTSPSSASTLDWSIKR